MFITSPATIPSPSLAAASSETSASPVFTAIRTWRSRPGSSSLSRATASRTASAARTARSGSFSWATGAPKTATTASPMNFSTVPPKPLELVARLLVVDAQELAHVLRVLQAQAGGPRRSTA